MAMPTPADAARPAVDAALDTAPDTVDTPAAGRVTTVEPLRRLATLAAERRRDGAPLRAHTVVGQAIRLAVFAGAGLLVVALARGTGTPAELAHWWADPVAYQKVAAWGLLWELLGLGGGGSARVRLRRPVAVTHWLRPGTPRLAPWPRALPVTAGTRRTVADVALYALTVALVAALVLGPAPGGRLPAALVWTALGALVLLGLRDKVPFLAARPDVYLPLLLVAAFAPGNTIAAAKLCLAGWFWGRAVASMTRAFPAVVALGAGDAPWRRWWRTGSGLPAAMWAGPDAAPVPSTLARAIAAAVPALELAVPLVLVTSSGGTTTTIAVGLLVALQVVAMSSLPADAAVETEAFLVLSVLALFGAGAGRHALPSTTLAVLLAVLLAGRVLLGVLAPRLVSPIVSLRFHSGTEAVSLWLLRDDVDPALAERIAGDAATAERQLAGRALLPRVGLLLGLLDRAAPEPARYRICDGELVAERVLGWSLGDGRLAGTALLDHLRRRADLAPGQVRLLTLAAQGARSRVHYRITDAASGKLEEGTLTRDAVAGYRPFDADQPAPATTVTFRVLPPPVAAHRRPRPTPGAAGGLDQLRLAADGAVLRQRPRPSR